MERGNDPKLIFDKRGDIFAISTGADATSEHQQGSQRLQNYLCGFSNQRRAWPGRPSILSSASVGAKSNDCPTDEDIIADLRAGKAVVYPDLLARKAINQNLDKIVFKAGKDHKGQPAAVLGASSYGPDRMSIDCRGLEMYRSDQDLSGTWDESGFAVQVRGEKLVPKLERFAERLKEGDGVFAGTFLEDLPGERLSGVIIALKASLRLEHNAAIKQAQQKWEASLRLKAHSRLDELYALVRNHGKPRSHVRLPGALWPIWAQGIVDGEVVYGLNPENGVVAPYYGPYTFEQLKNWILAETKSPLEPYRPVTQPA